jgi:adenosine deaminase
MSEKEKNHLHGSKLRQMFYKLMSKAYSPEKFENKWHDFEEKASKRLATKQWLQKIYESKYLWAETFVKKKMFLGMSTNQRSENINSKLHRYQYQYSYHFFIFEISDICDLDWISFLVYPNLFGIKSFVVIYTST